MSQIPYENNLSSFNLSNERIYHFIIFAYCPYFSFLFLCHVIFAHDILEGIFAMPVVFPFIFCLDYSFGFST